MGVSEHEPECAGTWGCVSVGGHADSVVVTWLGSHEYQGEGPGDRICSQMCTSENVSPLLGLWCPPRGQAWLKAKDSSLTLRKKHHGGGGGTGSSCLLLLSPLSQQSPPTSWLVCTRLIISYLDTCSLPILSPRRSQRTLKHTYTNLITTHLLVQMVCLFIWVPQTILVPGQQHVFLKY